ARTSTRSASSSGSTCEKTADVPSREGVDTSRGQTGTREASHATMRAMLGLAIALLSAAASPPPIDPSTLGPAVGQPLPPFEARDQHGHRRDFASLKGPNGLVLVFFRSADW